MGRTNQHWVTKNQRQARTPRAQQDFSPKFRGFDTASEWRDNYRNVSCLPTEEDFQDFHSILKANVIDGCYKNPEHYLGTIFRLLREDFIHSLRLAVQDFRRIRDSGQQLTDRSFGSIRDANVYLNASIERVQGVAELQGISESYQLSVKLPDSYRYGMDWDNNSRLRGGALITISNDKFRTFAHTVVFEKPQEKRRQYGSVNLILIRKEDMEKFRVARNISMVESTSAYYEAYIHTLSTIQDLVPDELPLKRYLVNPAEQMIREPYARTAMDYSPLFSIKPKFLETDRIETSWMTSMRKLRLEETSYGTMKSEVTWPEPGETVLNEKQYAAVRSAFTRELCVIQGPPGTGKTFVAKKIVELQILNRVTTRPILVVCYTNHALDQFLEGIAKFTDKIKRYGGSSKNPAIARFVVSKVPKKTPEMINLQNCQDKISHLVGVLSNKELLWSDEHDLDVSDFELFRLLLAREISEQKKSTKKIPEKNHRENWRKKSCFTSTDQLRESLIEKNLSEKKSWLGTDLSPRDSVDFRSANEAWRWMIYREIHSKFVRELSQSYLEHCPYDNEDVSIYVSDIVAGKYFADEEDPIAATIQCLEARYAELAERVKQINPPIWRTRRMNEEEEVVHIIGMTTTGAAKNRKPIEKYKPEIVIVEEAAEVLEAHILACLPPSIKQLILIGDHQQLQPATAVYKLATDFNLQVSMFERLVRNKFPFVRLNKQHRMRDEIRELLVPTIYEDYHSHTNVSGYPDVKGMTSNMYFVNHSHTENVNNETLSKTNNFEADLLINLAAHFVRVGYKSSEITILATYRGQVELLTSKLRAYCRRMGTAKTCRRSFENFDNLFPEPFRGLRITTVDNYQGEENIVVLVSLVRSNVEGKIGFLSRDNRVCVALSRAKHGLFCVGNLSLLASVSPTWSEIMLKLRSNRKIGHAFGILCQKHNVRMLLKDGDEILGCHKPCETLLDCGHLCTLPCHFEDHIGNFACKFRCAEVSDKGPVHEDPYDSIEALVRPDSS